MSATSSGSPHPTTGAGSSKTMQFSLPADFAGNPIEAPFPRQLIIYDENSNTWNPIVDKDLIVRTRYLCVSYRQSDFVGADRRQLELDVQAVCHQYGLLGYWLDYACTGETQEEKNRDLYRIADVFRGASKTLIMIKGADIKPHSPGWLSWGDRVWTLPEALLSGYRGDRLLYKAGTRAVKPIALREIANYAYKSGDEEMKIMNSYSGEPVVGHNEIFEMLWEAIKRRSSGSEKGKEKSGVFTAYDAERVYALMGFMNQRILPDPTKSEEDALSDLKEANGFNKSRKRTHSQAELSDDPLSFDVMGNAKKNLTQNEREITQVLEKIPYTGGMRYDGGKRCLNGTRIGIIHDIIKCIDNENGMCSEKRIFLLTGVAGSGKSTIAHSIAKHYDDEGQLGSSFFFSVSSREKSQPKNLFRTIAKDIADKTLAVREKLYAILKDNSSLCTTESIKDQYGKFIRDPTKDVFKDTVVIVIDALDECERNGDARTTLLRIIAEEMSAISSNLRIFLTVRAGDAEVLRILNSAQCTRLFTMDKIDSHSKNNDIPIFFNHKFSKYIKEFPSNWLGELTRMLGNLFIWATTVCSYKRAAPYHA